VVENRPGGGQNIGARACVEAAPDGYTLCLMSSEPAVYNQFLFKTIPYDPEKDLQPISNLFFNTLAVVIVPETKVKTFAAMVAMAKQQPGKLSYATFSFPATYFMDQLNKTEGTDIVKVPYRGGGEVVNALLGGTTPIAVLALSNMVSQLQSGRITPLAVVAKDRSPLFPDVPTLEQARPGADFPTTWFGLFTQAGVPRPIVEKISAEIDRIMADPAFRKRMYTDRAVEPAPERLGAFAKFIREERKLAQQMVKESGVELK
jgi:tripartite-type tricarboxylate transporter receptor subunit TctC